MKKRYLTNEEITFRLAEMAQSMPKHAAVYGVPRGGIAMAYWLAGTLEGTVVDNPVRADIIVDDLVDSGATMDRYKDLYPDIPFYFLYDHTDKPKDEWLVFPWEVTDSGNDESATDIFTRLLEYVGEDPAREGLIDTPRRMAKAWQEWTAGYTMDPKELLTVFEDGSEQYDEIVLLKDIPFYSKCEHHLETFYGTASIGYIPRPGSIIGISKLGRILDMYAQRLQVQERLTNQIALCIEDLIAPLGVGVVIKAKHFCTMSRGLKKDGQTMVTSSMRGVFRTKPEARAEFMELIK